MMQLTVLGAGTCLPVANHSASGYLVRIDETPLLLDAGPGTIARLNAAGVSYCDLEYVFITHLHSDHTLDLATLMQALVATPGWKREKPLYLTGCRGLAGFMRNLQCTFDGIAPKGYELRLCEMVEELKQFPLWTVETAFTGHAGDSVALRIEAEGRALVYSGDAVETPDLVRLAHHADLFVCECSLPNGWPPTNHLMAGTVGRIARGANVKRLLLTHLYPPALESDVVAQAHEEFAGEIDVALDGMQLEV